MTSSARSSDGAARSVVIAELWAADDPARLAADDPQRVPAAQMKRRASSFDSWDLCDEVSDAELAAFLPVIERESPDGRNAVKKSVS